MDRAAMRRRDFFKSLGVTLGGATLAASCGDGDGPSGPSTPFANAYRFYPVKSSNSALPGGGSVRRFRLDVTIDGRGDLLYGVIDANDRPGIYGLRLSFSGSQPPVAGAERKLIREGDVLPDGHHVLELHSYDVNAEGACVISVEVDTDITLPNGDAYGQEIIYRGFQESSLAPLVFDGFVTSDGHTFEGHFGDIDTHTGHDILLVAHYLHKHSDSERVPDNDAPDDRHLQGIFLLPAGNPGQARLVVNIEDLVADGEVVAGFGLVDLHDGGHFVAQAHPARTTDSTGALRADADIGLGTRIVKGHTSRRRASPITSPRPSARTALLGAAMGDSTYGPRLGPDQRTAFVLHTTDTSMALYYHGLRVVETGERSGAGNLVSNMSPPVFGPDGEIYYVLITTAGHELYVGNGEHSALLLKSGDRLAGDAREVALIALGQTTEQVDPEGRLAFIATFTDETAALVVGIPV
jgi:hypothetical protein